MDDLSALLETKGYALPQAVLEKLAAYQKLLIQWNERMDLTNVPPQNMARVHFLDSLLPLFETGDFSFGAHLIDVGTGAGFPGLALAVARPDMRVTLLDSLNKRCAFLRAAAEELRLGNVTVVHARAEDYARGQGRQAFDLAVARAVANLPVLLEYLLPYVKVGGQALCWKGPQVLNETEAGQKAARLLGGGAMRMVRMPMEDYEHYLVCVPKVESTKKEYPRKAGIPNKNPLGVLSRETL